MTLQILNYVGKLLKITNSCFCVQAISNKMAIHKQMILLNSLDINVYIYTIYNADR